MPFLLPFRSLAALPAPALLLVLSRVSEVRGQITNATCLAGFDFLFNNQSLSPCQLAANVLGTCYPDPPLELDALDPGWLYPGPTIANESHWYTWNQALCSMPAYNMLAACENCQSRSWVNWAEWTQSCNASYTGEDGWPSQNFPRGPPFNVSIPVWVGYDSSKNAGGGYDVQVMSSLAAAATPALTASSSSAPPTTTTTGSPTTRTTSSSSGGGGAVSPTATAAPPTQSPEAKSNGGAIAGGVVGGLAVVALAGGALVWLLRAYKRREEEGGIPHSNQSTPRPPPSGQGYPQPLPQQQYQPYPLAPTGMQGMQQISRSASGHTQHGSGSQFVPQMPQYPIQHMGNEEQAYGRAA